MTRPGVRVSGGTLKGARLRVLHGVRPTSQRVREALASRWQARLPGASVLDLFAGSGAVGLEAASRGAAGVLLVEAAPRVCRELTAAAARLAGDSTTVCRSRLPEELERAADGRTFHLVFADPPYDFEAWSDLLQKIGRHVAPEGEVAIEHSSRIELPSLWGGLERVDERRYGDSMLSFFRPSGSSHPEP